MAADQRRKRLSCASIAPAGALEQRKVKKKKVEASQTKLTAKSHISLEWDENQNRVVAKGEQIGISLRHLRPYVGCASNHHNILGDVVTLPHEIFELKDLEDILSYEVWQTHLSENERSHLMQFLPQGIDKEQVLQMLFAGESFQFGNPFAKWGESVCSGQLHPDAVISHEKHLKADKKVYYSELQKYHTETIGFLQNLKENWESCEDPVIDDVQTIWRSRRDTEQGIAVPEQDASVTSESCSWNADEKACSSNNQDSSADKVVEFQKRKYTKGSNKDKHRTSLITSDKVATAAAKPRNGDKVRKRNIQQNDGSEYMSYVKISKKQHQLVKSMKHPGQSIQSRSLNRVLGSLDGLHVQSYDVFMEEEQRKLHEHWLKLAKEHLPAAYTNWRHIELQKREIINSLNQDLHEKINVALEECAKSPRDQEYDVGVNSGVLDEDGEKLNHVFQDPEDTEPTSSESSIEDDADATMASFHSQSREKMSFNSSGFDDHRELESEKVQHVSKSDDSCSDASEYEYSGNLEGNQGVHPSSAEDIWAGAGHSTPHSYHDSTAHHEYTSASRLSPTTCHSDKMTDLTSGLLQEETRKVSLQGSYHNDDSYHDPTAQLVDFGSGLPKEDTHKVFLQDSYHDPTARLSSLTCHLDNVARRSELSDLGSALPKEVTQRVFLPDSYHDPTARHEYASTSGLSLSCHQDSGLQRIQMVDLKSGLSKLETEKVSLQGELNNASFNCYPNQPRNDLLQSLFKDQQVLPYQEKRQTGLDFLQPQKNVFMGDSRFPGHFQEHLQPSLQLEQGQMRQNETYLLPNLYSSSNSGRYVVPSAQELSNMGGDWNINPVRMTAPFQQQLGGNGDMFSQNLLLPNAHQVQNGWNNTSGSVGVPNQGNAADQSLFSVLSQCSQLQSTNPYASATRSTEQFISPLARNGNNLYGIGNSAMMNNLQPHQASNPLDLLGGRDATMMPGAAGDDMGWMNMNMNLQQHQNPGLHDPLGRPPYLRSWNQ